MEEQTLKERLKSVIDPAIGRDIVSLGFVKGISVNGKEVEVRLKLTSPACPHVDEMVQGINAALEGYFVKVVPEPEVPSGGIVRRAGLQKVKNVIAVGSGKGGVGKSTVTIMLALALKELGAKVGIMDLDFYGASIPSMLGPHRDPEVDENGMVIPADHHGIKAISISYFIPPGASVAWRGPLLAKGIEDFVSKVNWGELDYLLSDLPPGTGDVPLTLAQQRFINASVVVTTPQQAALSVALKMVDVFKKMNVPVAGIIENMSYMTCPGNGEKVYLFGKGLVEAKAKELGLDYFGSLPLIPKLREMEDTGIDPAELKDVIQEFIPVAKSIACKVSVLDIKTSEKPFYLNLPKKK